MLPNFIIAGTAAAGTSFLTAILLQHKEVYLPKNMRPEPHFFYFSEKYKKGIGWYEEKWFSESRGQKAVGERSSSYFYHKDSAIRIAEHLPGVKLIFVLRNPIERAWANYRYTVLNGLDDLSFSEALRKETDRIKNAQGIWSEVQPHDYTGRSMYGEHLEHYLKYFSWDQILIVQSEKLSSETELQLNRVTDFLEVSSLDNFVRPPVFTALNVKCPKIQAEIRESLGADKFNLVIESIRKEEKNLFRFADNDSEREIIQLLYSNMGTEKKPIEEKDRYLLSEFFARDQEKFFVLAQQRIDFEPWL